MLQPGIRSNPTALETPRRVAALFNKPAAGNAGIASQLTIEHHWPGVSEPER